MTILLPCFLMLHQSIVDPIDTLLIKNEIERQVESMLKAGTIVPSISPFASPILLVKKKDDS
jgi:hypothetical protein